MSLPSEVLESFRRSFRQPLTGSRRCCQCGRVFYNPDESGWDWNEGELDALAQNPNATGVDYAVESVWLEGKEYASDCDCWHRRAEAVVGFLHAHRQAISAFFRIERERLAQAAESYQPITPHPEPHTGETTP